MPKSYKECTKRYFHFQMYFFIIKKSRKHKYDEKENEV